MWAIQWYHSVSFQEQHNSGSSSNHPSSNSESNVTPHNGLSETLNTPSVATELTTAEMCAAESADIALQKRVYVMKELVDTEEKYVEDLKMVCDGYIKHMRDPNCNIPMPDELKTGKHKIVVGNIEAIYEWHRELVFPFLPTISYVDWCCACAIFLNIIAFSTIPVFLCIFPVAESSRSVWTEFFGHFKKLFRNIYTHFE